MTFTSVHEEVMRDVTDEVLASRASTDFDAFTELYNRYMCRIYRFIRSQTPDDSVAEDLTAQTFFNALSSAGSFRGRGSYRAWIFRIARNAVATWRTIRSKGPVAVDELPDPADPAPSPATAVVRGEERVFVRKLVSMLPPAQREVLSLRYLEDLSTEEVARITGRTRGAVRILLHRARMSLRSTLEQGGLA